MVVPTLIGLVSWKEHSKRVITCRVGTYTYIYIIYIYIYTYIYTCIYIWYIYTYIYIYIYVYIYIQYVYTCVYIYIHNISYHCRNPSIRKPNAGSCCAGRPAKSLQCLPRPILLVTEERSALMVARDRHTCVEMDLDAYSTIVRVWRSKMPTTFHFISSLNGTYIYI